MCSWRLVGWWLVLNASRRPAWMARTGCAPCTFTCGAARWEMDGRPECGVRARVSSGVTFTCGRRGGRWTDGGVWCACARVQRRHLHLRAARWEMDGRPGCGARACMSSVVTFTSGRRGGGWTDGRSVVCVRACPASSPSPAGGAAGWQGARGPDAREPGARGRPRGGGRAGADARGRALGVGYMGRAERRRLGFSLGKTIRFEDICIRYVYQWSTSISRKKARLAYA